MVNKKFYVAIIIITAFLSVGFVNSEQRAERNLKVLPKDISDEKLDSLMHTYNKGLGVTCDFCHAKKIEGADTTLNFASDDNPVKEEGRRMIRLTVDINKNYFNTDPKVHPAYLTTVSCYTCHKGNAYPEE